VLAPPWVGQWMKGLKAFAPTMTAAKMTETQLADGEAEEEGCATDEDAG
jgi:hypothetical protein